MSGGAATRRRVALVTGGTGGIGRETCRQLAQAGLRVIAADLPGDDARQQDFAQAMQGHDVTFVAMDVTDPAGCESALAGITASHGPVDVLVNGAGITRDAVLRKMTREQWDQVLSVNLDSVFNLCKLLAEGMCERGYGRIVNITSASIKNPIASLELSNGARLGLTGAIAILARKASRHNVTINGILPGPFDTDRLRGTTEKLAKARGVPIADIEAERKDGVPAGRFGNTQEFGATVAFLCSAHAGFITGQNLLIDGGAYPGTY